MTPAWSRGRSCMWWRSTIGRSGQVLSRLNHPGIMVDTQHIWNSGCWRHWGMVADVKSLWRWTYVTQLLCTESDERVSRGQQWHSCWLTYTLSNKKNWLEQTKGHFKKSILCSWQLIDLFSWALHWKTSRQKTEWDGHSVKIWSIFMIFKGQRSCSSGDTPQPRVASQCFALSLHETLKRICDRQEMYDKHSKVYSLFDVVLRWPLIFHVTSAAFANTGCRPSPPPAAHFHRLASIFNLFQHHLFLLGFFFLLCFFRSWWTAKVLGCSYRCTGKKKSQKTSGPKTHWKTHPTIKTTVMHSEKKTLICSFDGSEYAPFNFCRSKAKLDERRDNHCTYSNNCPTVQGPELAQVKKTEKTLVLTQFVCE